MLGESATEMLAMTCRAVAAIKRCPASDPVTPRADEQLAQRESDGRGRESQLHRGCRDIEIGLHSRQRRQVHVNGERAESGQRAQDHDIDDALAMRDGIARMNDRTHAVAVLPAANDDGSARTGSNASSAAPIMSRFAPSSDRWMLTSSLAARSGWVATRLSRCSGATA